MCPQWHMLCTRKGSTDSRHTTLTAEKEPPSEVRKQVGKRSSGSLGLMIGLFSNIEDGPSLLPVPTVDWQFAEDWNFHLGLVTAVDPGIGVEISYQASESLLLC